MKTNLLTMLALSLPALAQTTVKDALVKHWKVTSDFTIASPKRCRPTVMVLNPCRKS